MVTKPLQVPYVAVVIDTRRIMEWNSFHEVFIHAFGLPDFYGRNMDAWIDCMTGLDVPSGGLSKVHVPAGGVLILQLDHAKDFASRCPEQYAALVQCSSFVNWRRIEAGEGPILGLSFYK